MIRPPVYVHIIVHTLKHILQQEDGKINLFLGELRRSTQA